MSIPPGVCFVEAGFLALDLAAAQALFVACSRLRWGRRPYFVGVCACAAILRSAIRRLHRRTRSSSFSLGRVSVASIVSVSVIAFSISLFMPRVYGAP